LFRVGTRFTAYDLRGRPVGTFQTRDVPNASDEFGDVVRGAGRLPEGTFLALASAPARPARPVASRPLKDSGGEQAIAGVLKAKKLRIPRPRLMQHLRVDLNGDGTEETLLAASAREPAGQGKDDVMRRNHYSAVVLRFTSRNTLRTVPLAVTAFTRGGDEEVIHHSVLSCKDIDGDGRMEVIVHNAYYEGEGAEVFTFDGNRVRRVI
jgi:hypothetical protein